MDKNWLKKHFHDDLRLQSWLVTSICFFIFIAFTNSQINEFSPTHKIQRISDSGLYIPLSQWNVNFHDCTNTCTLINAAPFILEFPAFNSLESLKSNLLAPSNTIEIWTELSIQIVDKIKERGLVNLVIPSSVQSVIEGEIGNHEQPKIAGSPQNVVWTIRANDIDATPRIKIYFTLPYDWTWFGPSDFPIAIVDANHSSEYATLSADQGMLQALRSSWYVLFPLVVALMLFIIDYSLSFRAFALFLALFSLRTLFYSLPSSQFIHLTLIALNALMPLSFLFFCTNLLGMRFFKKQFVLIGVATLFAFLMSQSINLSDLISDLTSSLIGFVVISIFIWRNVSKIKESNFVIKTTLLLASVILISWSNGVDLFAFIQERPKDPLQIGHAVPIGILFLATLIDLGSVRRLIESRVKAEKTLAKYDAELSLSQSFQKAALPKNLSYSTPQYSWNVQHRFPQPFSSLWFDVDNLTIGQKDFIMGCIFESDLVGFKAAHTTPLIYARWEKAKQYFTEQISSHTAKSTQAFLQYCAIDLNDHLLKTPERYQSSVLIFALDLRSRLVQIISCDHPGALISDIKGESLIQSGNPPLGFGKFSDLHVFAATLSNSSNLLIPSARIFKNYSGSLSQLKEKIFDTSPDKNAALIHISLS